MASNGRQTPEELVEGPDFHRPKAAELKTDAVFPGPPRGRRDVGVFLQRRNPQPHRKLGAVGDAEFGEHVNAPQTDIDGSDFMFLAIKT